MSATCPVCETSLYRPPTIGINTTFFFFRSVLGGRSGIGVVIALVEQHQGAFLPIGRSPAPAAFWRPSHRLARSAASNCQFCCTATMNSF